MKLSILLALLIALPIYAADSCGAFLGVEGATSILMSKYRQDRTGWTSLSDPGIEHSDFACGQVCAVNLVQVIRIAIGLPELKNPAAVVNELNANNPTLKSGLSAANFTLVLDQLLEKYVPGKTDLKYEALASTVTRSVPKMTVTRTLNKNSININLNTAKILAYLAISSSGQVVGAHFVNLAKNSNNSIEVIDPNFPEHLLKMEIEPVATYSNDQSLELIPSERIFINPAYGFDYRLLLIGVATVSLEM